MKQKEIIVGIDVSKSTIDVCILSGENYKIKNEVRSIKSFFSKIKKQQECALIVGMENTGYYNWPCYQVFLELNITVFIISPFHLKRSLGLMRGKNDRIDAQRIAKFINLHKVELNPSILPRKEIRSLQALFAQRNRLIETIKRISVPAAELAFIAEKEIWKGIVQSNEKLISNIKKQVLEIEQRMMDLINGDSSLKIQFKHLTSVQGVGKVLAWAMLIKTNEFKSMNNPRKLACYAGVVPFDFQSGTSINKRPRVSVMADKALKKLLHMAAMRAIQLTGDLKNYFNRKVAEGKNKMCVLNAVRNKIVARICAVVNKQKNYQINLQLS